MQIVVAIRQPYPALIHEGDNPRSILIILKGTETKQRFPAPGIENAGKYASLNQEIKHAM